MCILRLIPHPVVPVHNDGFMECNKMKWNEKKKISESILNGRQKDFWSSEFESQGYVSKYM